MNDFKYLVDEFADLKIMRYRIPDWENLTLRQKEYLYYLSEAAKSGRDILFDQNYKHNLVIRKTLEAILNTYKGDRECDDFQKFVVYAKRVFFSNGIHHHYAEDKFFPEISEAYFAELVKGCDPTALPINKGVTVEAFIDFLVPIIFDPSIAAVRRSSEDDIIVNSAVNFYEGNLTKAEVEAYYAAQHEEGDERPISYGLNSRLVKENGRIYEKVYKADGLYGEAIQAVIGWLEKANQVAENDAQRHYTQLLIEYYCTGNLKTWDAYNIAWVQDNASHIDFVNGFIEDYGDPMGMKATWESVVDFKDMEATKRSNTISANAQWFEDHSPVDPRFKKEECKGVSAKSIIVTTLGGDCFPTPPIGINLPNADWIRKDYGSKSVTITNLMEAYDKAADENPKSALKEFAYSEEEVALCKKYGPDASVVHTNLHECLGHGSGKLLPTTSPNALKEFSSTLEEARADLFGLYYIADPKMVELGIMPDSEAYKAEYCGYIRNGLMTQLARVELGKDVTESHMQNRKLIAEWCLERGQNNRVIEKIIRDGKTYFVVNDFDALRALFGELLAEVQRIKSEGDYAAGKALVERYAVKVDQELHKEVKERYNALGLKPYGGFINPEIVPVFAEVPELVEGPNDSSTAKVPESSVPEPVEGPNDRSTAKVPELAEGPTIIDYRVEYPLDFLAQHLEYGKKYSFLKQA